MTAGAPAALKVAGLVKRYGAHTALHGADLHVDAGELVGPLGPDEVMVLHQKLAHSAQGKAERDDLLGLVGLAGSRSC